LREELKQRLLKHINFLEIELRDYPKFREITQAEYREDRDKSRNVERWVENIINSSIDISKVILTYEGKTLPDNYREIVLSLSLIKALEINNAEALSYWVRFRNIISHEYLDIRWASIKKFIAETEPLYRGLLEKVKIYLEKQIAEDEEG
jgi:uncharacterized protein YutE (UPF0331/DUF86 family)